MCNKVDRRIECIACGYPYSEAMYSDSEPPLLCDSTEHQLNEHITFNRVMFKLGEMTVDQVLELLEQSKDGPISRAFENGDGI